MDFSCTDGNYVGSVCAFTCSDTYGMIGTALSVCIYDETGDLNGTWNRFASICQSRNKCFHLFQENFHLLLNYKRVHLHFITKQKNNKLK